MTTNSPIFPVEVIFVEDGTCFSCPAPVAAGHNQCAKCEAEQVKHNAARAARRAARHAAK